MKRVRVIVLGLAVLAMGAKAPRAPYVVPEAQTVVAELRLRAAEAEAAALADPATASWWAGQAEAYEAAAALLEARGVAQIEPRVLPAPRKRWVNERGRP